MFSISISNFQLRACARGALCFVCALLLETAWGSSQIDAYIGRSGQISLEMGGATIGSLRTGGFEDGWEGGMLNERATSSESPAPGERRGEFRIGRSHPVESRLAFTSSPAVLNLNYELTPKDELNLIGLFVALQLDSDRFAGGEYRVVSDSSQTTTGSLPASYGKMGLFHGKAREVSFVAKDGGQLRVRFASPEHFLLQDDRQWGRNFTMRIGAQSLPAKTWPAGKSQRFEFSLEASGGLNVLEDGPVSVQAGAQWVPLEEDTGITSGSALDFSGLVAWHAPAGSLGCVLTRGSHFVFAKAPEKPARFYGTNLCFTALYPDKEKAVRLAEEIQRYGYNVVRIHHYESSLTGERPEATTSPSSQIELDPESLDRLDFLASELIKRGVYLTTDLFVSRPIPASSVWPGEKGRVQMDEYKMAVLVSERAYEDYKRFARTLLEHVNPYTKRRWADEPALAWISLVNEGNPTLHLKTIRGNERLRQEWQAVWNAWLKKQGVVGEAASPVELPEHLDQTTTGELAERFLAETHQRFFLRTRDFLRKGLGCQALLTDLNCYRDTYRFQRNRDLFDYVDQHFYVDHPDFIDKPWHLPSWSANTNPMSAPEEVGGIEQALARIPGQPFALTEWNYAAPSRYRAAGGLLTGALAALQDWGMITRFAWSHSEVTDLPPGGLGYFDLTGDPAHAASERAAVCLFRRGDMRPAPHEVVLDVSSDRSEPVGPMGGGGSWSALSLVTRVGSVWSDRESSAPQTPTFLLGTDGALSPVEVSFEPSRKAGALRLLEELCSRGWIGESYKKRNFQSETGEMAFDIGQPSFTVSTERTCGGAAGENARIEAKGFEATLLDAPAALWVSSLDDKPLSQSQRMLLAHVPEILASGTRFANHARNVLLSFGANPHLVRRGRAVVRLKAHEPRELSVWRLSTGGRRLSKLATACEGDTLVLNLDSAQEGKGAIFYEVVRE